MKWLTRLILLAGAIALGVWGWSYFFPSPQKVIEGDLLKLARQASFTGPEGNFKKLAAMERIRSLLAENIHVVLGISEAHEQTFDNREELLRAALAARSAVKGLQAEFSQINVIVNADHQTAVALLTLKATIVDEADPIVAELKFTLKKDNNDWLITRIEPVKALR